MVNQRERIEELRRVAEHFGLPGVMIWVDPVTVGHINETLRVVFRREDGSRDRYIFQQLNRYVFREPFAVMENIARVTEHLKQKNAKSGSRDPVLEFFTGADGRNFYLEGDRLWRVCAYVPSAVVTAEVAPAVVRRVGEAFGRFQRQLADMDASALAETIPNFHDTALRLETLLAHEAQDPLGRASEVTEEMAYVRQVADLATELSLRFRAGMFPLRVTHNDTKANNVLFSEDFSQALMVVDLDTVMPGFGPNDFGDAVRFITNTAAEDEADLSRVSVDLEKFTAFAQGFLRQVGPAWSRGELDALVQACFAMTMEVGIRFLDDYLTGDHYFRTEYPGQNLARARCQLALAKDMQAKWSRMQRILAEMLE